MSRFSVIGRMLSAGRSNATVPSHLQCAFDRARLRIMSPGLEFHLAAQIVSTLLAFVVLRRVSIAMFCALLLSSFSCFVVWYRVIMPRTCQSRLGEAEPITDLLRTDFYSASVFDECAEPRRCRRSGLVDQAPIWSALRVMNCITGCTWAVFTFLLVASSSSETRLFCLLAGVVFLATVHGTYLVRGAVALAGCPLVVGSGMALAFGAGSLEGRFVLFAGFTLVVTGAVVLGRQAAQTNGVTLLSILDQREQAEITSLLMRNSDNYLGDRIWRTDACGRIQNPSALFAEMCGVRAELLHGMDLATLLDLPPPLVRHGSPPERLSRCLRGRLAFRDICIPFTRDGTLRWWTVTGRPVFVDGVFVGHRGVCADITDRYDASCRVSHDENHDAVTALPNRLGFAATIHDALMSMCAERRPFVLLLIGVEGASYQAERALRGMADELRSIGGGMHGLCRYGPTEFLMLCRAGQDETSALSLARSVAHAIIAASRTSPAIRDVRIGIVLAPEAGVQASKLLEAAADALDDARRSSVDTVRIFDHDSRSRAALHETMLAEVRAAVRDRAFELVFQPILDCRTLQVCGAEALSRWNGVASGRMSIDRVINMIEADNLGDEFDLWVLETACISARNWPGDVWVSVNMGAAHFTDQGLPKMVERILERTGMAPTRLQIEVTETLFLEPRAEVFGTLAALNELGVRVAVDDFGKGFSSLGYLRLFPFSKLKLDGSFVVEMLHEARTAAVVRSVLELGVDLGIPVVAEGVATREQYEFLRERGCPQVQGFFFARPMPEQDLLAYLGSADID